MSIDPKYAHLFPLHNLPEINRKQKPRGVNLPSPPPLPGVYITDRPEEAHYWACLVDAPERVRNTDALRGHRVVEHKHDARVVIYITDDESQADICIYRQS